MSTEEVKTAAAEAPAPAAAAAAPASSDAAQTPKVPVKQLIEEAKRDVALKQFSAAADKYAEALEKLRDSHEETEPLFAPIFHRYGQALLEHAIATSGALGGGGGSADVPAPARKKQNKAEASGSSNGAAAPKDDPRFSFGGDGPDSDEEEDEEAAGEGNAEEEEEDDLSVAFSVLELARVGYERILAAGESAQLVTLDDETWGELSIKAQLAEVHNDLGDVGLESENFQQASADYEACLKLLTPLLHSHSRRLADAYLRLGLALEFHPEPSRRTEAEKYVQGAAHALRSRSTALEARLKALEAGAEEAKQQAAAVEVREEKVVAESAGKGKGKAAAVEGPLEKDDVAEMDLDKATKEAKDVKEMTEELEAKLEEYAQAPPGSASIDQAAPGSNKQLVQDVINEAFLGASTNALANGSGSGSGSSSAPAGPVNDLSSMVKKKKKPVEAGAAAAEANGSAESSSNGKRKAEDAPEQASSSNVATEEEGSSKRARVETAADEA